SIDSHCAALSQSEGHLSPSPSLRSRPCGEGLGSGAHGRPSPCPPPPRSEEHTSELQSQSNLVCRLLRDKKNKRRLPHRRGVRRGPQSADPGHLETLARALAHGEDRSRSRR